VVLPHQAYIRDFWASGLLDRLRARGHRLHVLAPEPWVRDLAAALAAEGAAEPVEALDPYYGRGPRVGLRAIARNASFVQRSALSTYRHKLATASAWDRSAAASWRGQLRALVAASRQAVEIGALRLLGRVVDLEVLARRVDRLFSLPRSARALLARARPDLVLYPSVLRDAANIELFRAARRLGVPQLGFVASWDTLTSKGFFLEPPDALMVWGEDSRDHALAYHGYAPDRVVVTGAPHFDVYGPAFPAEPRHEFLARRGIPPDKRVLLFAGTTVSYWSEEPEQLRALSRLIEEGELKDCVVWYRPHPRRAYDDVARLAGLPGVHIDDQMLRYKARRVGTFPTEREGLAHYRGLMDACEGVITAFSTMIIEAALMGKPSLVVAFGLGADGRYRLVEHEQYEHLREVLATPGVTACRSMAEMVAGIHRLLAGEFAPLAPALRARAGRIAANLDGRARERMVAAIERFAGGGA
jgi:hypothetical protein